MAMAGLRRVWLAFVFLTTFLSFVVANVPFDQYVVNSGSLNNVTIAVNVPSNTSDDLFFYFSAPVGQQWSAFGFGSGMSGALIFVAYPKDNHSVTLSPRIATGHVMPQYTKDVNVTLLPGSGIVDEVVVVNAQCTGCRSWNGGSLNVKSTAQNMIWAVGPAVDGFQSDDTNVVIRQHGVTGMGTFTLDMTKATGDAGVPVVSGTTSNNTSGDEGSDLGGLPIAIHAFLMTAVFLVVFPLGYLFLRVFEKVWLHMGIQTLGAVIVTMATASGIVVSERENISPKLNSPHQVIGMVVFILVLTAWTLGLVGHRIYKKTGVPAIPIKVHRGIGPSAMVLGLVNVGIGFSFAGNPRRVIPFYIATLLMIVFVSGVTFMVKKRKIRKAAMVTPAAQNFNQAYCPSQQAPPSYQAAAGYYARDGEAVPMQDFGQQNNMHPGSRVQ